ncbi:hypothetical protein EC40967_A0235 [Escherichia coli 4.0967]|uniref:Uncharacterized protein n=8 Tax=Enterobacteriaceae TaxID=543 RepID=A0A2P1H1G1_ECOLX|nr:hypothetical protein KPH11_108 [Klebsiella pneumoniae subsp. pneumoniae]ANA09724.1 hypothetical protein pHNSHP45-2-orf00246 [Escherichia coli]AVE23747.1 hypothetical protein [Enterobacter cloacae]EII35515.1 hypothetical protein EC40967_A0235 [Escherichia coli 4.0967]UIX50931.1 hypothetical protein [Escherichia coli O23:H4]CDI45157.1 hypothetical protein [Escherichia coli R178]CED95274.1 hypothetical protein [Salmonella enterica subsp. enterica serovar Infantis]
MISLIWHCEFLNAFCGAEDREKPTTQNLRKRARGPSTFMLQS